MAGRWFESDDGLLLEEVRHRLAREAAWLSRDTAELTRLLERLRARRRILLVGPVAGLEGLTQALQQRHEVLRATTAATARELALCNPLDAVVADHALPGAHDGLWLCHQVQAKRPAVRRVLMAAEEIPGWHAHERSGLLRRFLLKLVHPIDLADLLGAEENA